MKYFIPTLTLILSSLAYAAPGDEAQTDLRRLSPLTEWQQAAGLSRPDGFLEGPGSWSGTQGMYRVKLSDEFNSMLTNSSDQKTFGKYHDNGDLWPADRLEKLFKVGMLSVYVRLENHQKMDPNANYAMLLRCDYITPTDINKMNEIASFVGLPSYSHKTKEMLIPQIQNASQLIKSWENRLMDQLASNKLLMTLGGIYQKEKIMIEKKEKFLKKMTPGPEQDQAEKELLELDRRNIDMQTIIFHWVMEANRQSQTAFKEAIKGIDFSNPIVFPEIYGQHPFWLEIQKMEPEFTQWPYYKKLIDNAMQQS